MRYGPFCSVHSLDSLVAKEWIEDISVGTPDHKVKNTCTEGYKNVNTELNIYSPNKLRQLLAKWVLESLWW